MPISDILRKERSKVITIIGYIFVGFSILMIVSSMMGLVMNLIMLRFGNMPEISGPFDFVFKNFRYFAF